MPAPDDWLARPLWVLDVGRQGFAPVTWRDAVGLAALAFADEALGARHHERLSGARPATGGRPGRSAAATGGGRPRVRLLRLDADDPRAREEWLRAVLAAGAARVAFDPPPGRDPDPADCELTGALLAEVLATKRGLSCL